MLSLSIFLFIALFKLWVGDSFRIDKNVLKFIDGDSAQVIQTIELVYFSSNEPGGYVQKIYQGKLCSAWHPDQFYHNWYLEYKGLETELVWILREKQDTIDDNKYDINEVNDCLKKEGDLWSYRDPDKNFTPIFLSHVMIIDSDIPNDPNSIIKVLRNYESPVDILILTSNKNQTELLLEKTIDKFPDLEVSIHHSINFNCQMLAAKSNYTKLLCLLYCVVSVLWIYRNTYHYPNTMTALHRMLTIPPILKFFLLLANYNMFYQCPWNNISLKVYTRLIQILLDLVYESILVAIFFLIAMGFKIAKSNISNKEFGAMITGMLINYVTIFILMVFNTIYHIGTILYTIVNLAFLIYTMIIGIQIVNKLLHVLNIAQNQRYPEQAIRVKISLMAKSLLIIAWSFSLEVFYHGVLRVFGFPFSRQTQELFYILHESTDFIVLASLLFILKTRGYIPYFGVINLDSNNFANDDVEMQQIHNIQTLEFEVNPQTYKNNESSHSVQQLKVGDVAIIVGPDGPDEDEFQRMTTASKHVTEFRKLQVGVLTINHKDTNDNKHQEREWLPLFSHVLSTQ